MLEIRELSKYYSRPEGRVTALEDFSLSVKAGEMVAVQGPSGCGKSTLLLATGGLLKPDKGAITLDGNDPYQLSSEDRARFRAEHIGFIFQQFHLVPYLSVMDNVLSSTLAMSQVDGEERARKLLEHFGLGHRLHHRPGELSTGERQRCALARAVLHRPKLILADEPTGNLDPRNAEAVLGYLRELAGEGCVVLIVTHDRDASEGADRIVRLESLASVSS